jgi:hypothetical protein
MFEDSIQEHIYVLDERLRALPVSTVVVEKYAAEN